MAYFAAVAAFSINAATSRARERKIAWLPGSSMTCDWARFAMNRSRSGLIIRSFGDHGVARLLFPGCNRGLGGKCVSCNRYLRDRHEARDRLRRIGREIGSKRIGIHGEEAVAYRSDAFGGRRHFVAQIGNALPDIRLEGRHENESLDAGMRFARAQEMEDHR